MCSKPSCVIRSLKHNTGKNPADNFTDLCTVYIFYSIFKNIHKMHGKRTNNLLEIRAYIKGRSQLSIKPVDIHGEVCDIYGEDQMSYRMICRWLAKFRRGQEQLKDATHTDCPATMTTKSNIEKIQNILQKDA